MVVVMVVVAPVPCIHSTHAVICHRQMMQTHQLRRLMTRPRRLHYTMERCVWKHEAAEHTITDHSTMRSCCCAACWAAEDVTKSSMGEAATAHRGCGCAIRWCWRGCGCPPCASRARGGHRRCADGRGHAPHRGCDRDHGRGHARWWQLPPASEGRGSPAHACSTD